MHSRHDRRMRSALEWRGARRDALHAGNARGDNGHMRRGNHRVSATWHVATNAVYGDVPVAENDPRKRFDLQVLETGKLLLREIADLRLSKTNIVEVALADACNGALDVSRTEPKVCRGPLIEFRGECLDGGVSSGLDVGKNRLDGCPHLGVSSLDGARVHSAFEIASHNLFSSSNPSRRAHDDTPGIRKEQFSPPLDTAL
jgi:hypothetical protein